MKNRVKVETYKNIDIFYCKSDGRLTAENKNTKEEFEARYLFEIRQQIDEPIWEKCVEKGFMIDGVFHDEIYLMIAEKRNTKTGEPCWIRSISTGRGYDKGKLKGHFDSGKPIYPYSEHNKKIFKKVRQKEMLKNQAENNIKNEISKLLEAANDS